MRHIAQYLDSGFYVVSDRAAGALCRVLGQKLRRPGWEKFVLITVGEVKLNAWLTRTDLRASLRADIAHKRGWRWAIYALRRDGGAEAPALGEQFQFQHYNT